MVWDVSAEKVCKEICVVSSGGRTCAPSGSFKKIQKDIGDTGVAIIYSVKRKLYEAKISIELPHFGNMDTIWAGFVGVNQDSPRWYLEDLCAFRNQQRHPILSWENQPGVALLLSNLQGAQPHYLDLPRGVKLDFEKEGYKTYSSTDSPGTRRQIKTILEELYDVVQGEHNLSDILRSDLLSD